MADIAQETAIVIEDVVWSFLDHGLAGTALLMFFLLAALYIWRRTRK